jgi:beta-ribofuranosylaminobenzene 5'-phosphate synthase
MASEAGIAQVEIRSPARLHLGFLDLDGDLGRRFGSLGLTIDGIGLRLRMARAAAFSASGPDADRALSYAERAAAALRLPAAARLVIEEAIPAHIGLGSGTQLGLAVAAGLARLYGLDRSAASLAEAVDRGLRSGIGIGAFDRGGFIVDGGRTRDGGPPPLVARQPFPPAWRILLLLDPSRAGLNGEAEARAFAALPPFGGALAGHLSRLVLMRLLPGLVEADFAPVAEAIGEIQDRLGDYFAGAQNGRYSSPTVGRALAWLRAQGIDGVGQTSWGPTGFALLDSEAQARRIVATLREHSREWRALECRIVAGRNRGADILSSASEGGIEP